MHHYPSTGYSHCRSGSDSGLHRRNSRREDLFDSGDSTLSDLDESESGSGSAADVDPNLPYPGMAPVVLRNLTQTTRPRSWCLALIASPWFERVSMMVIILNCITLGMYQPCSDGIVQTGEEAGDCKSNSCLILQRFDEFIYAFFSLEMTVKIIAMGFYGRGSYLADSWNWLDLFIVVAGAYEYVAPNSILNISAVRAIRVLRPLRAINRIPSMRILVMLLLDTLPMLGNVLLLCFFVFFIFGIIGVQLWQGVLRQRCFLKQNLNVPPGIAPPPGGIDKYYYSTETDYICSKADHSGMHTCDNLQPYKDGCNTCNLTIEEKAQPEYINDDNFCVDWNRYLECRDNGTNPFQNTISFDNIGMAWVSIFLVISLEGWTEIMYYVQDAHSFWDWIYFVLLIVIGSFFMINLCLVVIATQFSETKKREMERMRLERARFQSSSTLASSTNNSEPTSCYAEIVKYIAHLWRKSRRKVLKKIRLYRVSREQQREKKIARGETIRLNVHRKHHQNCPRFRQNPSSLPSTRPVSRTDSICISESPQQSKTTEDVELTTVSKRPSLLRVPSISNQDIATNNNDSPTNVLSPPSVPNNRRPSVMFSSVVVLHGENDAPSGSSSNILTNNMNNIDKKNVCSSEKTTQAGDGNIWVNSPVPNEQEILRAKAKIEEDCNKIPNHTPLTCQQLLALGAINATLPTGPIAIDTILNSLYNREQGEEIYMQQVLEDEFSCCQDLWNGDYKTEKRSKLYVVSCLIVKRTVNVIKFVRRHVKHLVDHKYFQQGILLAILINTMSMGIEHHQQPDWLTQSVEITNIIFSVIFGIEMVLKIVADGPFGYISNGFNVFDGVIVVLSAVEIFQKYTYDDEMHNDSGLSVLRTFRLLRILKLVRFLPNLRRQLFVMLRTMDNVAVFFSLLILFIFIFSILGMYLFGGKFCTYKDEKGVVRNCGCQYLTDPKCQCDRKHFNNILWATVTVFQILTQEDWNIVLSNGMAKTSPWAALYFVALMTFGNYVLFNLLVAILVEGFSSERNERREREQRELVRRKMSRILEASSGSSTDDSSRSISSSSGSCLQETKNHWRSAEELRKVKDMNGQSIANCDCHNRNECYVNEPKCNIQKESLSKQPQRQSSPPIITHTAATPQDSPSTTLDDILEFRYSVTTVGNDCPSISESSHGGPQSSTDSTQKTSEKSLSLLKPPTLSPPPLTFRNSKFERTPSDEPPPTLSGKIVIHNEKIGWNTVSFSEKTPMPPKNNSDKNHDKVQRKCSWKLSKKSSLRRNKRTGSDSEAAPLNNGRDHSQCNGGDVPRHASLRNTSLLQSAIRIQNDTQKDMPNNKSAKGLSPQNSIRCRSNTCSSAVSQANAPTPALTRHNSLTKQPILQSKINAQRASPTLSRKNSLIELKTINSLNDKTERALPRINMEECVASQILRPRLSLLNRLVMMAEPTGCFKEKEDYSMYLFSPNNRLRKRCQWLVAQKWFDNVVLLFIAMNCITLAMERPNIPPESTEKLFLKTTNYIFTVVFATEMFIKVVATGMCYGPNAYFTSGWNIMDGSLVIISIIDIIMFLITDTSSRIFGILRVFRLLRSLRPLRVINRAPGLKLVVQTLLSSLRPIGNIVLICCTFFIIFGILGVQLFKGTFYRCVGDNVTHIHTKEECDRQSPKLVWENQKYNFDDLGQALMSLFVLSSRDGWVNIMYNGLDAVGINQQPIVNYSEWRLLYFISFILLVGFFVLNMFVGVVVENFHRCREEQEKEERIRRAAKRALQLEKRRRKMNEPPYYINYGPRRLFIHKIVTSKYFDLAIAMVIGLNVITMATEKYNMPIPMEYALKIFNYFFTAVFILEGIMKLVALGLKLYVKDKWNVLDVFIVVLSVVGIVLEELKSNIIPINPTVLRVMRVMRIARVLKLLKMAKGIRALLDTVMQALPQVGNLGLLFFLLFFIFAALGVELFGRLDCTYNLCQGLGEHAHFENFGMAFLTLFRVATGDNWNGIMKDTLHDEKCDDKSDCVKNCCISPIIAPIFFVIFVLMAQFVLVNVVVAVLMKHLEESHKHLEDELDMDIQLEREFQEKVEMGERRELCLALQLDQECQRQQKPLTKVLSLPSNFTYNPPGTNVSLERQPSKTRRQTLHSHQPIMMANLDDIKNIDESTSDIYSIQEIRLPEKNLRQQQTNLDEIITVNTDNLLKLPKIEDKVKRTNETTDTNRLFVPHEQKPVSKLYGSTKHLFHKQLSMDVTEETPFLQSTNTLTVPEPNLKIPKHDSQESVQRIITERRKMDENMKEINQFDIFDVNNSSEENLVDKEARDEKG
ncbi:voltage-dependent T-type calcium channel subunit alpha-1H-like isoform X2 [Aethina tumida]|uniref:voltage-dependent T-type calcium channel subunit alpha-1H-like isoform X2 n=1 Tax=Aethina tumida TaxID=116153 RepID=UPI0021473544|nr:voltage-dependent T-type calcium channel subunit alpha-1H-like isoform X2 [Aethina tumida]